MRERGLFWPDVVAVIDQPKDVTSRGKDEHDRPKWLLAAQSSMGGDLEIICVIETDQSETVFITLYWKD
jgi:hypothetical protein